MAAVRRIPPLGALVLTACAAAPGPVRVRPPHWAQPVIGSSVDNWFRVSPDLYRCGQPDRRAMRELEAFGVRSVVNLREYHDDDDEVAGTNLTLVTVPLDAGELSYAGLVSALRAVLAAPKPTVVHCWHGADRTGAVIAAYRVAVDGWSPADALDEMVAGGFDQHAFFGNLRELIAGLDPVLVRADAGLPPR